MNNIVFDNILIHTLLEQLKVDGVLFIILAILLVCDLIYGTRTKFQRSSSVWDIVTGTKNTRNRLSIKEQIIYKISAMILILILMLVQIFPVYSDVSKQQYIEVEGIYSRDIDSNSGDIFSNGAILFEIDGEKVSLELPYNWTSDQFPVGTYKGKIWYGQHSKIAVNFEQTS